MRIYKAADYAAMSKLASDVVAAAVIKDPCCALGLATGSTPLGLYASLVARYEAGELDFSRTVFVNLDEYIGVAADDPNSYCNFMQRHFFSAVNAQSGNINIPNGMADDTTAECRRYDELLEAHPVDVQVLGIGHDGHIGFNEPGDAFVPGTHAVELDARTISANARFFGAEENVPRRALTMGIGSIMRARTILLLAYGADKAEILARAIRGPVTPHVPASVLQLHADVRVIGDATALAELI